MVIAVCFWGFANEITDINQAKRIYPLFCLGANSSGIFSGTTSVFIDSISVHASNIMQTIVSYSPQFIQSVLPTYNDQFAKWSTKLTLITLLFLCINISVYLLFKYVEKNVLTDPNQLPKSFEETKAFKKSNKAKYSMSQSLSRVSNSKYLLSVAAIVFSFAFINNIVELLWKSQANMYYTTKADLHNYYSSIIAVIGILSTLSALLVSGNVIRFLGWHTGAIITPIIMSVTTLLFFAMMIFPEQTSVISTWFGYRSTWFGYTPLGMIVLIGGIQNCLSRAAKYTLFDTTKELTLLPLKNESKREGKAVVDGIVSRFGKSSGSTMYIFSLLLFENMMVSVLFGIAICIFVTWTRSIEHINSKIGTIYDKYENKEYLTFNEVDQIPSKSIFKRSTNTTTPS